MMIKTRLFRYLRFGWETESRKGDRQTIISAAPSFADQCIASSVWQPDITENDIDGFTIELIETVSQIVCRRYLKAPMCEQSGQDLSRVGMILDE
jgi:hypothetical protein